MHESLQGVQGVRSFILILHCDPSALSTSAGILARRAYRRWVCFAPDGIGSYGEYFPIRQAAQSEACKPGADAAFFQGCQPYQHSRGQQKVFETTISSDIASSLLHDCI
jgi:hypothetical protein